MLARLKGSDVKLYLNLSGWGDHVVSGKITDMDESWLALRRSSWGRVHEEIIPIHTVKRVTVTNQ